MRTVKEILDEFDARRAARIAAAEEYQEKYLRAVRERHRIRRLSDETKTERTAQ